LYNNGCHLIGVLEADVFTFGSVSWELICCVLVTLLALYREN
jgi:hypothetical protein